MAPHCLWTFCNSFLWMILKNSCGWRFSSSTFSHSWIFTYTISHWMFWSALKALFIRHMCTESRKKAYICICFHVERHSSCAQTWQLNLSANPLLKIQILDYMGRLYLVFFLLKIFFCFYFIFCKLQTQSITQQLHSVISMAHCGFIQTSHKIKIAMAVLSIALLLSLSLFPLFISFVCESEESVD